MQKDCEEFIANEFNSCVDNTISRLLAEDTHRPFHRALLSDEALFWSRFERSFSTSFGQRVIEKISRAAVISNGAEIAINQKSTEFDLPVSQMMAIDDHIASLRGNRSQANWIYDIDTLSRVRAGDATIRVRVISDLFWQKDGIDNYMSIKTVMPNIDQTAEAKRDLLKIKLAHPRDNVYYGLYYNPFGDNRQDYSWSPPKKIFDFKNDVCVLIGKDYWDTLGGSGFYEDVIEIAERVGDITRKKILRMGIDKGMSL